MKRILFYHLVLLISSFSFAQNEPYLGGIGRGDVQFTSFNNFIEVPTIYYGGIGRGDVQFTSFNNFIEAPTIYYGGIGRGDISIVTSSQLNNDQIWVGPAIAGNNLFSNGANWQLGYAPKIGNIKVDNAAVRDMQLVANVNFDTLFFQNNTQIKAVLDNYNLKLKHFTASSDRHLFQTNGEGSVVIPTFNNGKTLKFPVGKGDYNPVTVTNYNTTVDSIAVRVGDAVLDEAYDGIPINTTNVQRTWFVKKNNPNALGVDFVYEWDTTSQSAPMPGYYLNHYNGTDWEIAAFDNYGDPVYNGSRVTVTLIGYQGGFSPFTFGDSPLSPLPVELLNFNAVLNNRIVELTWQTASEHNNDFFTIERSSDGYNFETLKYVDGAGNSNGLLNYANQDVNPFSGYSYYRLKQTDFDGAFEYSDIRVVNMDGNNDAVFFPNPSATDVMYVTSNAVFKDLNIYAADGKLVFIQSEMGNSFVLNLEPGVYFANYFINDKSQSKKIIFLDKN